MSATSLLQVLDKYRQVSFSLRNQGMRFEQLMKAYLQTDPTYANYFQKVWLWEEFPSRADFFWGGRGDLGIDLFALTHTHEYWAIQCKFSIQKTPKLTNQK